MVPFQVIGQPGAGKTTFIAELVQAWVGMDIRVGTIKHSAHAHELDKPGKDSHVHRMAGASPAAMITRDLAAVYLPRTPEITVEKLLETHYRDLDVTVIEGWISGPFPKIEIWRKSVDRPPLFPDVENMMALISDDPLPGGLEGGAQRNRIQCFKRSEVKSIASWLLNKYKK